MDAGELARWESAVDAASELPSDAEVSLPTDVILAADRELRESGAKVVLAMLCSLLAGSLIGATLAALNVVPLR